MNTELAVPAGQVVLDCRGVVLTKHSLEIVDEESFQRAGRMLLSIDSYSQFWWGDYLLYAEKNGLTTVLETASAELHRSTIHSYIEVARLFAPADRHADLSFNHHAAIRYILGDEASLKEAKDWLDTAAKEKMTVGDLREAMRVANRESGQDAGPMRGVIRLTDFQKISKWTQSIHVKDLDQTDADEIRKCTGSLFEFLCELHRRPFVSAQSV